MAFQQQQRAVAELGIRFGQTFSVNHFYHREYIDFHRKMLNPWKSCWVTGHRAAERGFLPLWEPLVCYRPFNLQNLSVVPTWNPFIDSLKKQSGRPKPCQKFKAPFGLKPSLFCWKWPLTSEASEVRGQGWFWLSASFHLWASPPALCSGVFYLLFLCVGHFLGVEFSQKMCRSGVQGPFFRLFLLFSVQLDPCCDSSGPVWTQYCTRIKTTVQRCFRGCVYRTYRFFFNKTFSISCHSKWMIIIL